jgi:FlaA1/EpsC-like NDP-sugar epimerase
MKISRATLAYLHDLIMTLVAFVLALYLRVGEDVLLVYQDALVYGSPAIVLLAAILYRVFGLYRGVWRYASAHDLILVIKAVSALSLAFVLVMFLLNRLEPVPRSIPLMLWFILLVLLPGPRFLYRLAKDRRLGLYNATFGPDRIPVLLLGAGDGTELLIRTLSSNPNSPYVVVGIVDDKGRRIGREIQGVSVLGGADGLADIVMTLASRGVRPQKLIITRSQTEIGPELVRYLLEQSESLGLHLSRLPDLTEFKDGLEAGKIELRSIAIEDLLGRPQAAVNRTAIKELVAGRHVLVTGAGGTIGGELTRQLAALEPASLTLVDSGEFNLYSIDREIREQFPGTSVSSVLADVRHRARIMDIFLNTRPELVFHAAALKHVPLVESNPTEGILTNAIGTRNVADAARAAGAMAVVLISTDKAINPTSVMGASKRIAEAYCQALDIVPLRDGETAATRFMTVRFGNVLGSSGSVVPLFQRQLALGGPITVTHPDMRRYFMTVREAVELVLQASAYGQGNPAERGKIFVLDMGEPVKIVDLARQMIRLAGLRPDKDIAIEFTGLRPGEKLFEELLSPAEAPTRTDVDGILRASPRIIDFTLLSRAIAELERAASDGDVEKTIKIVGTLVPDFSRTASYHPITESGA